MDKWGRRISDISVGNSNRGCHRRCRVSSCASPIDAKRTARKSCRAHAVSNLTSCTNIVPVSQRSAKNHPAVVTSDDAMSDLVVPCARGPRRKGHAVHTLSLLGCTLDQEVALCAKEVRWTRHIIFWALRRRSERINPSYCSFGPIGFLHVFFQIYFVA